LSITDLHCSVSFPGIDVIKVDPHAVINNFSIRHASCHIQPEEKRPYIRNEGEIYKLFIADLQIPDAMATISRPPVKMKSGSAFLCLESE